jgi:hypothetical protein
MNASNWFVPVCIFLYCESFLQEVSFLYHHLQMNSGLGNGRGVSLARLVGLLGLVYNGIGWCGSMSCQALVQTMRIATDDPLTPQILISERTREDELLTAIWRKL